MLVTSHFELRVIRTLKFGPKAKNKKCFLLQRAGVRRKESYIKIERKRVGVREIEMKERERKRGERGHEGRSAQSLSETYQPWKGSGARNFSSLVLRMSG